MSTSDVEEVLQVYRSSASAFNASIQPFDAERLNAVYTGTASGVNGDSLQQLATSVPSTNSSFYFSGFQSFYSSNTTWLDSFMSRVIDSDELAELRGAAARTQLTAILQANAIDRIERMQARVEGDLDGDPARAMRNAIAFFYGPGFDTGNNDRSSDLSPFAWMLTRDNEFGTSVAADSVERMNAVLETLENNATQNMEEIRSNVTSLLLNLDSTSFKTVVGSSYVLQATDAEVPNLAAWGIAYTAWRAVAGRVLLLNAEAAEYIEQLLAFNTLNLQYGLPEELYCLITRTLQSNLRVLVTEEDDVGSIVGTYGPAAQNPDVCDDIDVDIPSSVLVPEAPAPSPAPMQPIVSPVTRRNQSGVDESEFGVDELITPEEPGGGVDAPAPAPGPSDIDEIVGEDDLFEPTPEPSESSPGQNEPPEGNNNATIPTPAPPSPPGAPNRGDNNNDTDNGGGNGGDDDSSARAKIHMSDAVPIMLGTLAFALAAMQ